MRTLIVDDDEAYLQLLRMIMERKGHEVLAAADGKQAWQIIQNNTIPFVITDWMLPEMDGVELIHRIREAGFPNYTYIILLTAKKARNDIVVGLESGADDYLTKPFDLSELRARIGIGERILDLETRLRASLQQLSLLASHDSLTGLLNRRALYEIIEKEKSRTFRQGIPFSVIIIDIDHFKLINDQYGHLVGDDALCQVAAVIESQKRNYDYAGRWGGEEFLVVLPGANESEACGVAERIRIAIKDISIPLDDSRGVKLHASLGVASITNEETFSLEKLIERADKALYQAKEAGRDLVKAYSQINPATNPA
jgi:two-component system chemotaxis response regulator CheY